jgi:phosphomevalonate kinase
MGGVEAVGAWRAELDSSAFFSGRAKLGLGSSAAVLTALAAAWSRAAGLGLGSINVNSLIELHRRFQGGAGSGLDVAAAATGGVLSFRLARTGAPVIGSVQLPNSVGFAGIFTGSSAATPDFVERFDAWRAAQPEVARAFIEVLESLAREGCLAARRNDAAGFLAAVGDYGVQLERLGAEIGRAIVTQEHGDIAVLARQFGVTYKVSGAGGGDLGLAFSSDMDALGALRNALRATQYEWIDLDVDPAGLVVEE